MPRHALVIVGVIVGAYAVAAAAGGLPDWKIAGAIALICLGCAALARRPRSDREASRS